MTNPAALAALPATEGHIQRAKEAVRSCPAAQSRLEALLASNPTRGQMVEFTGSVSAQAAAEELNQRINAICKAVGIDDPTGTDRLIAMQIGLLQDQNVLLKKSKARADVKVDDANGMFTALVGGMMLGAVLTH